MAFQTPITIRDAISGIGRNEYVLPAIQREFVWSADQVTQLFDSLMQGYPIGSFLFWDVDRDHCHDYAFYGFLADFHQRDRRHNPQVNLSGETGVTAILDGQQRLTSLSIGLRGSYAYKTKGKWWRSADAFPRRRLYLNLLRPAEDEELMMSYDFRFLTDEEAARRSEEHHWFPVSQVLHFGSLREINGYLRGQDLLASEYAENCLFNLYEAICNKRLINYYLETDQALDKVLNIFIRVNSFGTTLSYSDLLLSIATAQWEHIDARQAIPELVDDLNRIGEGFNLNKDFVLKSCLVLANLPDIAFRVRNFTRENTQKIEAAWPKIAEALRMAVSLASRFGYSGHTLTANNVLVPIAYYLKSRGCRPSEYLERHQFAADREAVRSWMTRALLKTGTFGAGLDTTLRTARRTIQDGANEFPLNGLETEFARIGRGLRFAEEEIEDLLDQGYGQRQTFSVLALLYPQVDFNNRFHIDHIFPQSWFTRTRLRRAGIAEEQIDRFLDRRDGLGNLQLLEGTPNEEKSSRPPAEWLREHYPTPDARASWQERNYVSTVPEGLSGFLDFYDERRSRMKAQLANLLKVPLG